MSQKTFPVAESELNQKEQSDEKLELKKLEERAIDFLNVMYFSYRISIYVLGIVRIVFILGIFFVLGTLYLNVYGDYPRSANSFSFAYIFIFYILIELYLIIGRCSEFSPKKLS